MPDDLKNRGAADAVRVNISEAHEIRYWTKKFGCTAESLKAAVAKVGPMARDVENELAK